MAELEAENARLRQRLAEAECRSARLAEELQHRTRNVLAVVRSVARRAAQTSETAEDYAMHLDGRLGAIARAQAMLARGWADGVDLDLLIAEELLAHAAHEGERVSLSGPAIRLRPKAAGTLALALHELAVNAVKYGALSNPHGRVAVSWRVEPADGRAKGAARVLGLEWRETGVPLPDAPGRSGFGTEVIERTLAYELGAAAQLRFDRDGVHCKIVLPLDGQVAAAEAEASSTLPPAPPSTPPSIPGHAASGG